MRWTFSRFSLFLALALTIWLWPSIGGGKVLLPLDILAANAPHTDSADASVHNPLIADVLYENLAWKHFQRAAIRNGEWPLWNPFVFCGHPLYATGQASTFYPLNALFWFVPLPYAYVLFTWLHLFLAGVLMFAFCRRMGLDGFASAVGGTAFALCGFFAVRILWPMLLGSAIWLPLMLLWVDWMAEPHVLRAKFGGLISGAFLFAMPFLSGFFEIAFYACCATGLFALYRCVTIIVGERSVSLCAIFVAKFAAVGVLAFCLAAPQLLPFFEVMPLNIRAGQADLDRALSEALRPHEALTLLMPDAFGNPARSDHAHFGPRNYVSGGFYLGLLPLAFAAWSLYADRGCGRDRFFFWMLLALSVSLAFGTSAYALLFPLVPGLEQVRTPFRWMYPATLAVAYLASCGAQRWSERLADTTARDWRFDTVKLGFVVALAYVLLFAPGAVDRRAAELATDHRGLISTFGGIEGIARFVFVNRLRLFIVGLGAAVILTLPHWRAWGRRGGTVVSVILLAFLAGDLGQATFAFNTHSDPSVLADTSPLVRVMQQDSDVFRIARYGPRKVLHPNLPLLYGLSDVGGYDSIILTKYAQFLAAIEFQKDLPFNIVAGFERKQSLDSRLFPLLNVRYLLSSRPLSHPDWQLVAEEEHTRLYRVRSEREQPRAFLVGRVEVVESFDAALDRMKQPDFDPTEWAVVETTANRPPSRGPAGTDPTATAQIVAYGTSSVRIHTFARLPQLLVLSDVHYPGWRAYVDEQRVDVVPANGLFRGVFVDGGQHTVEFRFEPAPFRTGGWMGIGALAALIGLAVAARWPRKTPPSSAAEATSPSPDESETSRCP